MLAVREMWMRESEVVAALDLSRRAGEALEDATGNR